MSETIVVTGASGAIGSRVARLLSEAGAGQRLLVRDAERAPSLPDGGAGATVAVAPGGYADGAAIRAACEGASTLLLVSAKEAADRVAEHVAAIDAARAAGVERIVYLSFLAAAPDATFTFARDHFATEQHVRASGASFSFLRPSLYADLVPYWVGADGVIRGPAGEGSIAWVTRDDVAAVAAAVLLAPDEHVGQTYDLTGPALMTVAETAALLAERAGRPVTYVPETLEEARASRAGSGAAAWEIEGWVTSYAAIASGEMAVVSDAVQRVSGRPPQGLGAWLDANPGAIGAVG
ncbi:NAD(P)H-binding protein [Conexibacter sp. JD483]|uniref:NmrA family NAD(P)-binding protein n=1 Tax=unclassified Conexibacter TaxID=2627773 RepID=UPI00271C786C|nr:MULTISPECIES: NAD(P)H-binding protein [unclassified Conexibacter]MDO8186677.1 NAD(P)H-binding protein [Conexibacter sp. CPCC 205706]MDO8200397.1 NAD(P)H-binding protein [Conexibacter sp. CPCC 205762]MDR9370581.1 NAD(P)H-binding protein [Conexibacter sp. JD483]